MEAKLKAVVAKLKDSNVKVAEIKEPDIVQALRTPAYREDIFGDFVARGKIYDVFLAKGKVKKALWDDLGECNAPTGRMVITANTDKDDNVIRLGTGGFATTVSVRMEGFGLLALKLSTSLAAGRHESRILTHLTDELSAASPHVIRQYFSFTCKGGPRREGAWRQLINDYFVTVPESELEDSLRESLGSLVGTWTASKVKGILYIGMELGQESLEAFLARKGPLPWGLATSLTFQILQGLAAMHAAGVLHRDIQSKNVVLTQALISKRLYRQGDIYYEPLEIQGADVPLDAKFIDFGISASGPDLEIKYMPQAMGMATYRAPEFVFMKTAQANGRQRPPKSGKKGFRYGPETDLFSAGLLIVAVAWKEPIGFVAEVTGGKPIWQTIYGDPPKAFLHAVKAEQDRLASLPANQRGSDDKLYWTFTYQGDPDSIAYYLWGLVHLLGMPSERDWSKITEDRIVLKLLDPFRNQMHPIVDAGGWIRSDFATARLGPRGQDMARKILSWDPKRRGTAAQHLESGYFRSLMIRGSLARYSKVQPEWGYTPGQFEDAPVINCKKR